MFQDEEIEALIGLGLTELQARVYLAIVCLQSAPVKAIAKTSGIARQDIYRVAAELQKKGLIEKVIASPVEYKAMPLKDAVKLLVLCRQRETMDARKKAMKLAHKIKQNSQDENNEKDAGDGFFFVTGEEASRRRFKNALDTNLKTVEGIFYWKGLRNILVEGQNIWETILTGGAKVRLIVYGTQKDPQVQQIIQTLKTKGTFNIKYTTKPPPATITIFDKNKVLATTTPEPNPENAPSLWLNNQSFTTILQEYFEHTWQTAQQQNRSQAPTP
ncbi:MAG: hypothetical protein NWF04_06100 [Candidatus Bathyarchaeota archaeon]|nr:hypothetical protein [Candidatus Bathyarchaeota archaeon]